VGLSFTKDLDCSPSSISEGTNPDPTPSYAINARVIVAAVAFRHFNRAKLPDARREKSITKLIIGWRFLMPLFRPEYAPFATVFLRRFPAHPRLYIKTEEFIVGLRPCLVPVAQCVNLRFLGSDPAENVIGAMELKHSKIGVCCILDNQQIESFSARYNLAEVEKTRMDPIAYRRPVWPLQRVRR
jgi:hypothetical protein